jgi:hypothetical protein
MCSVGAYWGRQTVQRACRRVWCGVAGSLWLGIAAIACSHLPLACVRPPVEPLTRVDFEGDAPGEAVKRVRVTQGGSLVASAESPFEGTTCAVVRRPKGFKPHTWAATGLIPVRPGRSYAASLAYRNPNGELCGLRVLWFQDEQRTPSRLRRHASVFGQKAGFPFAAWDVGTGTVVAPADARYVQLTPYAGGEVFFDLLLFGPPDAVMGEAKQDNLAASGKARCWDPNSGVIELQGVPEAYAAEYSPAKATDRDDRTYWVSNVPTAEPPKDIGVEWARPVTVACVAVKYPHAGCRPPRAGERLQCWQGGRWVDPQTQVADDERRCIRVYTLAPVRTTRVRLYITGFAEHRPSVKELEVYARPRQPSAVADHFDYTPPTDLGRTSPKPVFLTWYNPAVGFVAAEEGPRRTARATELGLSKAEQERAAKEYLRQFREAGFGGLLARHGLRPYDDPELVRQHVEDGFQQTGLPLKRHFELAAELGMQHNFLLMMFVGSWSPGKVPDEIRDRYKLVKVRSEGGERMVIDWLDDASWARIEANVRAVAELAKRAGARGVAYDVECYGVRGFYESRLYDYAAGQRAGLLAAVERRGRQLAQAITTGFPSAEIVWLAGYAAERMDINTALVRGLTSVASGGFYIVTETTYFSTQSAQIQSCYAATLDFVRGSRGEEGSAKTPVGVAPGTLPICAGLHRHLSPQDVAVQLRAFAALSPTPKYIWLYTGWYPFMDPELEGYRRSFRDY